MRRIITGFLASMLVIGSLSFVGLARNQVDRPSIIAIEEKRRKADRPNKPTNQHPATRCEMLDCKT